MSAVWMYFFLDELLNRDSYDHGQSSYTVPVLNFVAALVGTATLAAMTVLIYRGSTRDATGIFRIVAIAVTASAVLGLAALFLRPDSGTFMIAGFTVVGLVASRNESVRDWCAW